MQFIQYDSGVKLFHDLKPSQVNLAIRTLKMGICNSSSLTNSRYVILGYFKTVDIENW